MIELRKFKKKYGNKLIVEAEEIVIPGGVSVVRGLNGSGKTTLFRCIAGIIPFEGNINLLGVDQRKFPVKYRRQVSFSEAKPEFPSFLTGADISSFYCSARRVTEADVSGLQHFLGVDEFINDRIETYSEGMHKKLSLFLAFIGRPELVVLDEPFAFLDEESRNILVELIHDFRKNDQMNFLISNHISEYMNEFNDCHEFRVENHTLFQVN
jgi:ABC-2 type transport system ATP-binding protein